MSLLRQIQDAAIDSSVDLPTLLRKCKVLAARLGNEDFKQWIDKELIGYDTVEELPEYRILTVNSKGHFSGAFGSGIRNADIPLFCIPEKFRENFSHSYLMQPIAGIASLISNNQTGTLQEPWNPEIVALIGRNIYEHMVCIQAWKVIPPSSIVNALDSVRTRILNFVLEIETLNPAAGEAMTNEQPVAQDAVQHVFNTYITGNVQNVATGSNNVRQVAKWENGTLDAEIFTRLIDAINNANLSSHLRDEIADIVEGMKVTAGTSLFKDKYNIFMSILADHIQVLGPVVAPFLPQLTTLLI